MLDASALRELLTNGTSPLYLGPGSPVNSAWGREGFKTSSNNLTQTGYWFNKANWATTTSVAANAARSRPLGYDG